MHETAIAIATDGRTARGERTKREIVEAYIALLHERPRLPTVMQIAERAGYSLRTMYVHFADLGALSVAACDHAIRQSMAMPLGDLLAMDRDERIRRQVERRASHCERWLPLWRMLLHHREAVPELDRRAALVRDLVYERLQLVYRPELDLVGEAERRAILLALEALTDYASWGHMREQRGLTIGQACDVWVSAVDRLLPR